MNFHKKEKIIIVDENFDKNSLPKHLLEAYELCKFYVEIGNQAVHEAQEENRKLGIPNTYSFNGKIYFEMPDGTITTESPWEKLGK